MSGAFAGRYTLVAPLGGGGTSLVYRARIHGTGGEVALKLLRPQFAQDPALRRRFLREAELARQLNHPSIVRVLDAGEDADGTPFLALELMAGETLRQRLDPEAPLPLDAAQPIVIALARALQHAHGRGIIHRDLKPQNIFLTGSDPRLADFGNARLVSLASVTGASLTWGTPEYVAPEMFGRGRADPRSDLYALGVVFYEMLTGRTPWTRAEVMTRLVGGAKSATAPAPTGAGAHVDRVLARLLAFAAADRPASGEELVSLLARREPDELTIATVCATCGANRAPDVPLCFGCGTEAVRFGHDPKGLWRVVLEKLEDDLEATRKLLRVCNPLVNPVDHALVFLTGNSDLYSDAERKTGIGLPVVLFSDLDEATALRLEALFREQGLSVRAVDGPPTTRTLRPEPTRRLSLGRIAMVAAPLGIMVAHFTGRGYDTWNAGAGLFAAGAASLALLGIKFVADGEHRRKVLATDGLLTLRDQIAAVPVADGLLAEAYRATSRIKAPEVRALLADVAVELYRFTRRAEATDGERDKDLIRRTTAAAPALIDRLRRMASHVDALDDALAGATEGELMQGLARLERVSAMPGADRATLAMARRDLEATLDRRHAAEQDRARLAAGLCRILGQLRMVYRNARSLPALDEHEAWTLEAASAELEAFLSESR